MVSHLFSVILMCENREIKHIRSRAVHTGHAFKMEIMRWTIGYFRSASTLTIFCKDLQIEQRTPRNPIIIRRRKVVNVQISGWVGFLGGSSKI